MVRAIVALLLCALAFGAGCFFESHYCILCSRWVVCMIIGYSLLACLWTAMVQMWSRWWRSCVLSALVYFCCLPAMLGMAFFLECLWFLQLPSVQLLLNPGSGLVALMLYGLVRLFWTIRSQWHNLECRCTMLLLLAVTPPSSMVIALLLYWTLALIFVLAVVAYIDVGGVITLHRWLTGIAISPGIGLTKFDVFFAALGGPEPHFQE